MSPDRDPRLHVEDMQPGLDADTVWDIVTNELSPLRSALTALLSATL